MSIIRHNSLYVEASIDKLAKNWLTGKKPSIIEQWNYYKANMYKLSSKPNTRGLITFNGTFI